MFMQYSVGYGVFQIMFFAVFFFALATILISIVKGLGQWNKNNHSPRLTVPVKVVTKRTHVSRRHGGTVEPHHTRTGTTYYATFEVASGDRMELQMSGQEYGMLAEGDRGSLTFQGTRFLGFERE